MVAFRKAVKWLLALSLICGVAILILLTALIGGCPASQSAIRESVEKIINEINSNPGLMSLNEITPLNRGSKVVAVHMDNKLFGYDIEAELSNGSSIYLKINTDWRFCVPIGTLPADSIINDATSEPLKLVPEQRNERNTKREEE